MGLHYQSSLSDVAWVLNAYALFFGAPFIPAGRFADKYGRKATFILGLAVFTVASLACAASPDLWVLVGFRCVQAVGAAMIIPASLGLHDPFHDTERLVRKTSLTWSRLSESNR